MVRTNKRLRSYAESGTADFSAAKPVRKYAPKKEYQELADELLDRNQVASGSRKYLNYYIRHFFCFWEEKDIGLAEVTDEVLLEFLNHARTTNKGSMGQIVRALCYVIRYLKENQITGLRLDPSKLPRKRAAIRVIAPFSQEELTAIISSIDVSARTGL